ncbi:MAG: DegT/DnrJ/EryC1/StrS family aminotransferase [Lentisphaerae bacterium]|jgi:dTDP-4-amino-4,6-dideoxygalactose transaminase|nr:DegT/DnrJ/EryC1/StrS family aminotransferase [Lentisphaerota bacterium]MBT4818000.1 DegT/DnrJ/EryC1/StrS family aminotransferase [Lentisphaerota bacterium]MBT5607247.1 DegT/DnrJ/EryC1/StrS family aminotransferase [Lentisphaerota bacterium]MBT7058824.1 DegT/DnrJ/EryC1/StrS family aminotransferase [Lentisphaerota bacterium]MBT7842366.1 DegT/DnrJ/EryC1/StrS family aminotransferase [Lentisphaerota bacterium]
MDVAFYGHTRQYSNLKEELDAAILSVLESGKYVMGPAGAKFEAELAEYFGTKHAIGCNSGTDALWLVFMALGIGPGDEVITTTNTFFATAEAIWIAGAKAVFVDSRRDTNNIDPDLLEAKITPKTKAIVPVHLYGQAAEMDKIWAIAEKHDLFVIEDCAQAIDAKGDTFELCEKSDALCTSFIIQKNLGTFGDSGGIVTNRDDIKERITAMRNHGSYERSHHTYGFNSRLDDIHAAVLSVKLKYITAWTDRRIEIAKRYDAELADCGLTLPTKLPGYRHVFHLYVVETEKRDELLTFLNDNGIDAKTHYPIAIHQQNGFPWGKDTDMDICTPNAEANAAECVSLPMFPELTDDEVDCVIAKVREFCGK